MSFLKLTFKYVIFPLCSIYLLLVGYAEFSAYMGGAVTPLSDMYMIAQRSRWLYIPEYNALEMILVALIYYSVFFILADNKHRYWISLLPAVLFYLFYDAYFMSFGGVFKIDDISEVPELLDVLALRELAMYLAVFAVVIFAIMTHLTKNKRQRLIALILPTVLFLTVNVFPETYMGLYEKISKLGVTEWSDRDTAQNGALATTFYFEAMMHHGRHMLSKLDDEAPAYEASRHELAKLIQEKGNKNNIHIVVLESFFNPALFDEIKFNHETYDKQFSRLIANQESAIISPVFGGHTSQAEFEVLCGVPALHKYSAIEFNSFTGAQAYCLPGVMKEAGYRVIATNSYKPNFFNAVPAYRGIGFDEIYFPKEYAPKKDTYLKLVDKTKYIFDGDLLDQNLAFIKQQLAQKDSPPILNYVLGVYGHLEYVLDEKRHPIVIKPTSKKGKIQENVVRAFNQIYYRTQALAKYIEQLKAIDPDSLIVITADHLPRLSGKEFYADMKYRHNIEDNIHQPSAFYIYNGQVKQHNGLHQYEINNLILDYLTDNQYCKNNTAACARDANTLSHQYEVLMSRAVR